MANPFKSKVPLDVPDKSEAHQADASAITGLLKKVEALENRATPTREDLASTSQTARGSSMKVSFSLVDRGVTDAASSARANRDGGGGRSTSPGLMRSLHSPKRPQTHEGSRPHLRARPASTSPTLHKPRSTSRFAFDQMSDSSERPASPSQTPFSASARQQTTLRAISETLQKDKKQRKTPTVVGLNLKNLAGYVKNGVVPPAGAPSPSDPAQSPAPPPKTSLADEPPPGTVMVAELKPLPAFKDVSFRTDVARAGAGMCGAAPPIFKDHVEQSVTRWLERDKLFEGTRTLPTHPAKKDYDVPRSFAPTHKEDKEWYDMFFSTNRNPVGRQDVFFLVNWIQERMLEAVRKSDHRAKERRSAYINSKLSAIQQARGEQSGGDGGAAAVAAGAAMGSGRPVSERASPDYELVREQAELLSSTMYEVVRQVSTNCVERARLMAYCWQTINSTLLDMTASNEELSSMLEGMEQFKADLELRFQEAMFEVKTQYNRVLKESEAYRKNYTAMQQQCEAACRERNELLEKLEALQSVEELEKQLRAVQGRVEEQAREKEMLHEQLRDLRQHTAKLSQSLDDAQNTRDNLQSELASLKQETLNLTPRLTRRFDTNLSQATDTKQRFCIDEAISRGIAPETICSILRSTKYVTHMDTIGCLMDPTTNTAKVREALERGSAAELEKIVDSKQLMEVMNMLHHRIPPAEVATIITGRTPEGESLLLMAPIFGIMQDRSQADVMAMLTRASTSNLDRFAELQKQTLDAQEALKKLELSVNSDEFLKQRQKEDQAKFQQEVERKRGKIKGAGPTPAQHMQRFISAKWSKDFVGLGTGNDVPKFMRTKAKVRNRNLSKRDTEKLVKEIWADKAAYDSSKGEQTTLEEYVYIHLQKKVGIPNAIVEWGYNFMHGLAKYVYDADCELFLKILMGEVGEEVYRDQVRLQNNIMALFCKVDAAINGNRETGKVEKDEIFAALQAFFPHKTEERMKELYEGLEEALPPGETKIPYTKLFEEDREYNQGPFAEAMRDQQLQERIEYLTELEDAFYAFSNNDGLVDKPNFAKALEKVDPGIQKPSIQLYTSRAFFNPTTKEEEQSVEAAEAISRLKKGIVQKDGPGASKFKALGNAVKGAGMLAKLGKGGMTQQLNAAMNAVRSKWREDEMGPPPSADKPDKDKPEGGRSPSPAPETPTKDDKTPPPRRRSAVEQLLEKEDVSSIQDLIAKVDEEKQATEAAAIAALERA